MNEIDTSNDIKADIHDDVEINIHDDIGLSDIDLKTDPQDTKSENNFNIIEDNDESSTADDIFDTQSERTSIKKDIIRRRDIYWQSHKKHKKSAKGYACAYIAVGLPHVLLTLFVTTFNGAASFSNVSDSVSRIAFITGFFATIFSSIVIFFKLQERAGRHHKSHLQYLELYNNLQTFLLKKQSLTKLKEATILYSEKEKFINSYEPYEYKKVPRINHANREYTGYRSNLLENELHKQYARYNRKSIIHRKNEVFFKFWYKWLSLPQLLLTLIVTALNGLVSLNDITNMFNIIAFTFSITASGLNIISIWFKFQESFNAHHSSSQEYIDLYIDTRLFILIKDYDLEQLETQIDILTDKENSIESHRLSHISYYCKC